MLTEHEIRIFRDGNAWCALRGENLQEGIAAFDPEIRRALDRLLAKPEMKDFLVSKALIRASEDD